MTAILINGPAIEPVSMEEAKAHLRVENTADDLLISTLITTARVHVETTTRRQLIAQEWRVVYDGLPADGTLNLGVAPVTEIKSVFVYNAQNTPYQVPSSHYRADIILAPGHLHIKGLGPGGPDNVSGITVDLTAGYGPNPENVPPPLRQAVLQLVAHWYEHREAVPLGMSAIAEPGAFAALVEPYKVLSL